jgi:hypothetical protein
MSDKKKCGRSFDKKKMAQIKKTKKFCSAMEITI